MVPKPGRSWGCWISRSSFMICCAVGFWVDEPSPASPRAGSTVSARLTSPRSSEREGALSKLPAPLLRPALPVPRALSSPACGSAASWRAGAPGAGWSARSGAAARTRPCHSLRSPTSCSTSSCSSRSLIWKERCSAPCPRPRPLPQEAAAPGPHLHVLLVLGQPADVLLLLPVPLLQHCPLVLVEGNVLPCTETGGGQRSEAGPPDPHAAPRCQGPRSPLTDGVRLSRELDAAMF